MSELTQVAVLPYRFSNATPGEFLRQSAIANNKLLESEGFDAEPLAFIASKTLKHFGFLSHAAGWSKFSRRAEQSVMTRFAFGLQEPHGSAFVLRPTRNYPFGKRLKVIELLAVEAVIGEPVSASYFPDSREKTGYFAEFRPLHDNIPRLAVGIQRVGSGIP